jgi:hypothetical protein
MIFAVRREKISRGWRKSCSEGHYTFYASQHFKMVKYGRMGFGDIEGGVVSYMGEILNAFKILVVKLQGQIRYRRKRR